MTSESSSLKESTVFVSGMHCPSCARRIESGVRSKEGIKDVKVALSEGKVQVVYDRGKASLSDVKAAIEENGYKVVKVEE